MNAAPHVHRFRLTCRQRIRRPAAGAAPVISSWPGPIVLRVSGGWNLITAARYPAVDSIVWRSLARVPALDRAIIFGPYKGYRVKSWCVCSSLPNYTNSKMCGEVVRAMPIAPKR